MRTSDGDAGDGTGGGHAAGTCASGRAPRATVSLLFTDIEGSTRRWEESSAMFEQVERHFAILRDAVGEAGGDVFATMGDGIAACFDSAADAVRAAISAQRAMRATGLRVRMGIHTGDVERSEDDDLRGRAVNRAARIMAVGRGGQILVSDVAASLVRSGPGPRPAELVDVGTHRLRDLAEPERLWQVMHPQLDDDVPALRGLDAASSNLPTQRSSIIGRQDDVERVISTTRRHRIVTLTGVGGVGKTRLAVQAASELMHRVDRVRFVSLASLSDPGDVADAIAISVGATAGTGAVESAVSVLCGGRALIVVDNCEHVIDRAAEIIDVLTARCPDLIVIATSREALGIDGEHVIAVGPLEPATMAAMLFRERARAAGADVEAMPHSMLEKLCMRLDGLPLAIELAAARTASLGVATIVDGLDDRMAILQVARRRPGDRHGTMRATIDWSFRLLDRDEQRMFTWLSVFVDGFELDAACHVGAALDISQGESIDLVDSLVRRSMLSAAAEEHGVRYRMLETVRAYALDQLDERGEHTPARTALADWLVTIAGVHPEAPCNAVVEQSAIRLEREADNWREAVVVATALRSGPLAAGLCGPPANYFLLGRNDLSDVVHPLLELCDDVFQRRAVLCSLIVSASGATDPTQLQAWVAEVQGIDDEHLTGIGSIMRWLVLAWQGNFPASIEVCVDASRDARLAQSTRDLFVAIAVLDHFSLTDAVDDRYDLLPRALEIAERSDVTLHRVLCLLGLAWALADGDSAQSVRLVRRALDEIAGVPALTRVTLPGSASRLLTRLDPRVAAQALLDQIDASRQRQSFVDLIPLFYGVALLDRVGQSAPPVEQEGLTHTTAPSLSMMDFVEHARRAASSHDAGAVRALESSVREGLVSIACAGHAR